MKPCFGYVRVSTLKQGEGVSLEAQKEAIERFCLSNEIEIIRWFEEKVTAAKSGRPQFNAMLKLLRKGRAAGVVMHKIDRSARNFRDWATIGDLADNGIDVHFVTESLDFRSRGGRLSADIQAVIAADYIRNLKEEVRKGIEGRLGQGLYPFMAPLGYRNNGGGKPKTPDPVKAPLVKRAFELYASGRYSIRALQDKLNRIGLTNQNSRPISKGCLEGILNNPFYAGLIHIKRSGQTFPGAHEPIVSMALFNAVQAIKSGKAAKKVTTHFHTYRGLFSCKNCGRSMIAERQKGNVYYRCQADECRPNCIREEQLEVAIEKLLKSVRFSNRDISIITDAFEQWIKTDEIDDLRQSRMLQLAKIDVKLECLTDALIDRLIGADEFNRRKKKLELERAVLEEHLQESTEKQLEPSMVAKALERIKNLAEYYRFANPEEKREIAEIATSNRVVWRKKPYLEPSNFLRAGIQTHAVLSGGHLRDSSRTRMARNGTGPSKIPSKYVSSLVELANSPETKRLDRLIISRSKHGASNQQEDYRSDQPGV